MSKLYTEDQFLRIFGGIIATALKELEKLEPVQIVRCKDCKHNYLDGIQVQFNRCELNHSKVHADDWFCADGCLPEIMTPPTGETDEKEK